MVILISRKRVVAAGDVVARTAVSSLGGTARNLDIGDNLGPVSFISSQSSRCASHND